MKRWQLWLGFCIVCWIGQVAIAVDTQSLHAATQATIFLAAALVIAALRRDDAA